MSYYAEKTLTPDDLNNGSVLQTSITMEYKEETIITGTIYALNCEPLKGAIVQIIKININKTTENLGYVITNEYGEFATIVAKNNEVKYKFIVYEPIINL